MTAEAIALYPLFFFSGVGFLILIIGTVLNSKTREYRKEITDMYVAGKVRQLAEKDNINIDDEYQKFKLYYKKKRIKVQPLDNTIEEDIQEKIIEDANKETENKK